MTEFSENLQKLREKLPAGAIKTIAPTPGEKLRLNSMWTKQSTDDMTPGEIEMYDRLIDYRSKLAAENEERERKLAELVK